MPLRRSLSGLLLGLAALALCSCGGGNPTPSAPPTPPAVVILGLPENLSLPPGAKARLAAEVDGVASTAVQWSVSQGSLDADGFYTAPATPGMVAVTLTSRANPAITTTIDVEVAEDSASAAVRPAGARLSLWPRALTVPTGATVHLLAFPDGLAPTDLVWSIREAGGGQLGSALSLPPLVMMGYTAPGTEGVYHVTVASLSQPSLQATATLSVRARGQVAVSVSPETARMQVGQSQAFRAMVAGSSNKAVTWSVAEAGGGTITGAGVFTAPASAGTYHVRATSVANPAKSAQATVTVTAAPVVAIAVTPAQANLVTGATQAFVATVTGTANGAVTWTVMEAGGGSVSADGHYTAPASAGTFHVRATSVADPTKSAQATVTVTAPSVVTVAVSPTQASLFTGGTQAFTATVTGTANGAVTWTVVEPGGGSVSADGHYTAPGSAGTFHVWATSAADPTKSAQATVTVTAPPVVTVAVSPTQANLFMGRTQTFTATVTGTANAAVTWTVVEPGGGSVTATGIYTAPEVTGVAHVRATSVADPSKSAQATVIITAPPVIPCNGADLGVGASLHGYRPFPDSNPWNQDISQAPVDPNSAGIIAFIGAGTGVHADFGSGTWNGGLIGIPYLVTDSATVRVPVHVTAYGEESDPGPMPFPANAPVEGGTNPDGDRHLLVMDRDACVLYELYRAFPQPDGSWNADAATVWDLKTNDLRPYGWTSCDAAGLPIFPGLARYDEVAAGEITHALRFTVPTSRRAYVLPATHWASTNTNPIAPPMGMRVRLKAEVDISSYPAQAQVVLRALKKYGMILADNGSPWFITGAPDERWINDQLATLSGIKGADFEVLQMEVHTTDPTGTAPAISSFTGSPSSILAGGASTLRWTTDHATRFFVTPEVGWVTGGQVAVHPTVTTTYTLTAEGPFGAATATASITVGAPPAVVAITISPKAATVAAGGVQGFTAVVTGAANSAVTWSVLEAGGGSVSASGQYSAPTSAGTYHVRATSVEDASKHDDATVTVTASTPAPAPSGYLFLTASRLTQIRADAAANKPAWATLKGNTDATLNSTDEYDTGPENLALVYLVTGDSKYATRAYWWAQQRMALNLRGDSYYGFGEILQGVALVLNYCAPALTTAQAKVLADYLHASADELWFHNQGSGWGLDNPRNNYHHNFLMGTAYAGYALKAAGDARGDAWIALLKDKLESPNGVMPYLNNGVPGGDWDEGVNYAEGSKMHLALTLAVVAAAGGTNYFNASPFFANVARFAVYATQPGGRFMYPGGDLARDSTMPLSPYERALVQPMVFWLADSEGRRVGQWFLNHLMPSYSDSDHTFTFRTGYYLDVLFTLDLPETAPSTLPTAYHTPVTQWVNLRSGWDDAATSLCISGSPRVIESHQHMDTGSFTIWKGGWQAAHASTYSHSGEIMGVEGHNLLRVPNAVWLTDETAQVPGMLRYEDQSTFAYAQVDATRLYRQIIDSEHIPDLLNEHTREFVYLRPNTLVVFDRVDAKPAGQGYAWCLHFPLAPTLSGGRYASAHEGGGMSLVKLLGGSSTVISDADLEPGTTSFRVEEAATAATSRFLNVVEVGTGSAPATTAQLVSTPGAVQGALVGSTVALFSDRPKGAAPTLPFTYTVPGTGSLTHILCNQGGGIAVQLSKNGGTTQVTVSAGSQFLPDASGVIRFTLAP